MASSPMWKRPSDVMKRRVLKRKSAIASTSSTRAPILDTSHGDTSTKEGITVVPVSQRVKRKNPFAREHLIEEVQKRPRLRSSEVLRSGCVQMAPVEPDYDRSFTENAFFSALSENQSAVIEKEEARSALSSQENTLDIIKQAENKVSHQSVKEQKKSVPEKKCFPAYPMDWSLKTKVRYISARPFSWCAPLKSHVESAGLVNHLRKVTSSSVNETNSPSPTAADGVNGEDLTTNGIAKEELARLCLFWSHPHIPWLKLFPRPVNDTRIGKPSVLGSREDMQKALFLDWQKSLSSLFALLRSGHCPYFYVCSHTCTVLFRSPAALFAATTPCTCSTVKHNSTKSPGSKQSHCSCAGASSGVDMDAIVTPTTRGFRQSLREEGVEFTLPLHGEPLTGEGTETEPADTRATNQNTETQSEAQRNGETKTTSNGSDAECPTSNENVSYKSGDVKDDHTEADDVEDILGSDAGASSWLATLGIDQKKYRSLDPNKVKMQRESFRQIDQRPESAVQVSGQSACVALFNFLLNCRGLAGSTGELAGVPPHLLAPTPFRGATLSSLSVKAGSVRQAGPGGVGMVEAHSVELSGPLLPGTAHALNQLFRRTQGGAFTAAYSVLEHCTPLNLNASGQHITAQQFIEQRFADKCDAMCDETSGTASLLTHSGQVNNSVQNGTTRSKNNDILNHTEAEQDELCRYEKQVNASGDLMCDSGIVLKKNQHENSAADAKESVNYTKQSAKLLSNDKSQFQQEPQASLASRTIKHILLPVSINERNNGRQAIRELICDSDMYSWA